MRAHESSTVAPRTIVIPTRSASIAADLTVPRDASGIVIFAHGSGSSRTSPRNQHVARVLNDAGFATLLLDLLTGEEEAIDAVAGVHRFDIPMLATRLVDATDWLLANPSDAALGGPSVARLPIGYFGASTGAAAALVAAALRPNAVHAVVSRGGRPDMAAHYLPLVKAPTLCIVGSRDSEVLALNRNAVARLTGAPSELELVAGATHLFEESGALEHVASLARDWFTKHLTPAVHSTPEHIEPW